MKSFAQFLSRQKRRDTSINKSLIDKGVSWPIVLILVNVLSIGKGPTELLRMGWRRNSLSRTSSEFLFLFIHLEETPGFYIIPSALLYSQFYY
jgi:hypothetical protein